MSPEAHEADFYDRGWTDAWQDLKRYSPVGRHTRRWIYKLLARVPAKKRVADVGCGEGSLLEGLRSRYPGAELFGLDFSEMSVAMSRRRNPEVKIVQYDIRRAENPFSQVMDVIVCSEVIEHVDDDEAAVRNMGSWTRHLLLTVPSGRAGEMARRMGHLRHYEPTGLRSMVERAGLEVVFMRSWGFPFAYPWYARLRDGSGQDKVTGRYGIVRRTLAHLLYGLFLLNDPFRGGNKLFLLARNPRL